MTVQISCKSRFQAFKLGALLGFTLALIYGMFFVIYGVLRTSQSIQAAPANDLFLTLLANGLSVLIGSMFFAILFGLFAALFQAVTLTLVYTLQKALNPLNAPAKGRLIGLLVSLVLFAGLLLLFQATPRIMHQVFWNQSFIFWFGLPGILYLLMNVWLSQRLLVGEH